MTKENTKKTMLTLDIIKRFMTEREVKKLLDDYNGAKFRQTLRQPSDKDTMLAYEYKKSGLLTSEFAHQKGLTYHQVFNAVDRVSRWKFLKEGNK